MIEAEEVFRAVRREDNQVTSEFRKHSLANKLPQLRCA